jgi:hypothetical protein
MHCGIARKGKGLQRRVQRMQDAAVGAAQVHAAAFEQGDDPVHTREHREITIAGDVRNADAPVKVLHVGAGRVARDFACHAAAVFPGAGAQLGAFKQMDGHGLRRFAARGGCATARSAAHPE